MSDNHNSFRKMRRFGQQLTEAQCIDVLNGEVRGVLSVLGDDGYPYGVPIDFYYKPEDGKIYFHGAKTGHKQDAITRCDKVSFTVYDKGTRKPGAWALDINSVIVFGRIAVVEDAALALEMCRRLCRKFTDDETYIEQEVSRSGPRVRVLALTPEHITGKRVNES